VVSPDRFMEESLLLRLQVNASDISFLVACLARSFSGSRHAHCVTINLSVKGKMIKPLKLEKSKKEPSWLFFYAEKHLYMKGN
jgi:hypothetical protein